VSPGQRLLLEDVTWADFEAIVEELGRGTALALRAFRLWVREHLQP